MTRRWRHVKRGSVYVEVCRAQAQSSIVPIIEGSEIVVYRSESDGRTWTREYSEFEDGRFQRLPDESSVGKSALRAAAVRLESAAIAYGVRDERLSPTDAARSESELTEARDAMLALIDAVSD